MKGNSDRNASLVIGHRLLARYAEPSKEKPHALVQRAKGVEKSTGVALSQDAKSQMGPSISKARHGDGNGYGTAQRNRRRMETPPSSIPTQLRLFDE